MGRIAPGENIFESMRMILPEHREMMAANKEESTMASRTKTATDQEWQHKHLDEDALIEAGNLLDEARQDGFAVTVTFESKAGVRTVTGLVTDLHGSATPEIMLDVRGEVVRVSVANLIRVETARRE
ncbi:MAG: YolD-like family protein [Bacilli bacterium]